ncbi:cysteine hydrolase family protein [Microbacterium oleivorans]|uniref:cysteine hydrolase family protein n=1 Tax=Microbacterium oleivorans TaxID=273677 RepID=UPI0020412299|nr:isochorismatase family cysteine hydrolase [Microbacterium oleivorans]MCM3695919.1 cysteine hydrolase [Microbacterium oleivorans]
MTTYYVRGQRKDFPENPFFQEYLDPRRTAVVSIDMHEGHLADDPMTPAPSPRGRAIIDAVDAFHDEARALGIPIIHVRSSMRPSGVDEGIPSAWRAIVAERDNPPVNVAEHAIEGSRWARFSTRIEPGDELVTTKKRFSAFYPTDLDFLLRQMGVRTIVLNGVLSHCCVLNTAFDAQNLDYRVIALPDASAGLDEEMEKAAMDIISLHLGVVMDAAELTAAWAARSAVVA